MSRSRRPLYKRERSPARTKGVIGKEAPISLPDASRTEITTALYALCQEAGVVIGMGAEYDWLKDSYTVIGKSKATGKAQEITVQGAEVGNVITLARMLNGGRMGKPEPVKRPSNAPPLRA